MPYQCLFLINGLGLGNSTRCHAVIEDLHARGVEIHVLTSGNGLKYFAGRPEVASLTPTAAFFYSARGGRISGWRTLRTLGELRRIARQKRVELEALLNRVRPDLAVLDSEYSYRPLRRRGIPIVGLNNSDVVVAEYLQRRGADKRTVRSHFWAVEFPDYLVHKHQCDWVISPSLTPLPPRHARIRRVGLILRRELRERLPPQPPPFPAPQAIRSMAFMLSGSIHASHIAFRDGALPFPVDVVGRSGDNLDCVTFHGQTLQSLPFLLKADALVINGGFSAVSEAVALHKPTLVIPVPGHAEQWVNARALADLGCGYVTDEAGVLELVQRLVRLNRWEGLAAPGVAANPDGAREAADFICERLEARRSRRAPGEVPV